MDDLQRQIRTATAFVLIILLIGIIGFMVIEQMELLDAVYLTVITLATVGYGDQVPVSDAGRLFTIVLILVGLGSFAFAAQAFVGVLTSPELQDRRRRMYIQRVTAQLSQHYIICGSGEIADKTINYLLQNLELHQRSAQKADRRILFIDTEALIKRLDAVENPQGAGVRRVLRDLLSLLLRLPGRQKLVFSHELLVITSDKDYATHLRGAGLLTIEGDASNDAVLLQAGVRRASAMVIVLDDDSETLLAILSARKLNDSLYITATALEQDLHLKMLRVGANAVIAPYIVAGQFLNSASLRPAVNDYFGLLFTPGYTHNIIQVRLWDGSPWIGRTPAELELRARFGASVIGIRTDSGEYVYAPREDYCFQEEEILLMACPAEHIAQLQQVDRAGTQEGLHVIHWQPLPFSSKPQEAGRMYTLPEAERAVRTMSQHFVICGGGRVMQSAVERLNPTRPFVIISGEEALTEEMLQRGFRVIHGDPAREETLRRAGVDRAQSIMIVMEDKRAASVLAVLNCRSLSKKLLITATANTDDMIDKLQRAGADRVINPLQIAAQFIMLATIKPVAGDFAEYVLFNYQTRLETTELYMEDSSPWIGKTIEALDLPGRYNAGVIGIRLANGHDYHYAPPADHVIRPDEVLIVVTPMQHADELYVQASGGTNRRPATLRRTETLQSSTWSRDVIRELTEQRQ